MAMTGEELLVELSKLLDDYFASTTTGAGTTSTLVDTALQRFGEKANEEAFVRITTESATAGNLYDVRRITTFTGSTITFAPVLAQTVATSMTYQIHRWDPAKKFRALDRARILAFPQVARIVTDETLTSDGVSTELDIPSIVRRGPAHVWAEEPIGDTSWNLLTNSRLTSTSSWTATSVTAAVYTRTVNDSVIPKLESTCVKLTSGASGTLSQALGATYGSAMAGRRVSFGVWLYSLTNGPVVRITDNAGSVESDPHMGNGWEFLQVSKDVSGTNTTTLTALIVPGTNNAVYVERALFGAINRIPVSFPILVPRDGVQRDSDEARLLLVRPAPRGRQYRIVGRAPVSELGSNQFLQASNTMEVDTEDQDLLLATAARVLLTWEGMSTGEIDKTFPIISVMEARFRELQEDWKRRYPRAGYISTWAQDR